jgi:hypothetical protein
MTLDVETKLLYQEEPWRVVQNRMSASEAEARAAHQKKEQAQVGAYHHANSDAGAHRHSL